MTSIPSSSPLWKLKNEHLTKLLIAIGGRSSGTKGVLIERLGWECARAKLPSSSLDYGFTSGRNLEGLKSTRGLTGSKLSDGSTGLAPRKDTIRVLSIDMGIKNLAFCVCDVPVSSAPTRKTLSKGGKKTRGNTQSESTLELSVVAWKRIAVTGSTTPIGRKKKKVVSGDVDVEEKEKKTSPAAIEGDDPFSPMQLSKTAYKLVREVLLPYNPDTILIERQRFRSGGGSAVQEWTVRVNMFESMIWAVLTTLKKEALAAQTEANDDGIEEGEGEDSLTRPQIWDVSPMRVATFWISKEVQKLAERTNLGLGDVKKGRKKVEKREKVDLVQRWILADAEGIEINEAVTISFEDGAAQTRDAFMASKSGPNRKSAALRKIKEPKEPKERKKTKEEKKEKIVIPLVQISQVPGLPFAGVQSIVGEEALLDIGKLDDLADCLLQAGAWMKWEGNRRAVRDMVIEGDVEGLLEWIEGG